MQLYIYKDEGTLTVSVADWIVENIRSTLKQKDRFTLALSGGNTPKKLFSLLASEAYCNKIDWNRMHIFWGDERAVPFDDERNNAKVAFEVLLDKVPLVLSQVHRMETSFPEKSAIAYENLLHTYFDGNENSFDLVMLGIGEDGHTLSVFPGSPLLNDHHSWVSAVFVPDQEMWRITLTPLIVNKSTQIIFLVSGPSKSGILHKILEPGSAYPASLIKPLCGELHWFVDEAAASELNVLRG